MKAMLAIALTIGLALALVYVGLPEYRAGIAAVAPYFLILACPLAMMFMMKGTRGDRDKGDRHKDEH